MSTIQKINLRKKDDKILDLLGNLFQVKPFYRLYLDFPFKNGVQYLTRDTYSNEVLTLIHTSKGYWYGVYYILELDMYLLRKLEWLSHNKDIDIRTIHQHGKRRKKVSKTLRNYGSSRKVSAK